MVVRSEQEQRAKEISTMQLVATFQPSPAVSFKRSSRRGFLVLNFFGFIC